MRLLLKYWKSLIITALICYLSFAQPSNFEKLPKIQIEHFDKLVHLILYFILTLGLLYDHKKNTKSRKKSSIIAIILFPIILGAFVEIAQQKWFSPRTGEWLDWTADILGVLLASVLVLIIYKLKQKA